MHRIAIGFLPFAIGSAVHVVALAIGAEGLAEPTKLLLMPLLASAVLWGGRGSQWGGSYTLLFTAIALSWLGDGAGIFFVGLPTVPLMLLFFGIAHLCYIRLFWRHLATRPVPPWAMVYGIWWVALVAVLLPVLLRSGANPLVLAVPAYGLVLGGTALAASRCHPLIVWGSAVFLVSDTVLAFRLFTPEAMPDWTSPLVMLTYCAAQGLIAAGVIVADRSIARSAMPSEAVR
jgi:YhhN family